MTSAPTGGSQPVAGKPAPSKSADNSPQPYSPPEISAELMNLLFRAAHISSHYEKKFNLSFTSILLAFLASDTPSALWFQSYVRDANIAVEAMLSSQKIDRPYLENLRTEFGGERKMMTLFPTASARSILQSAEEEREKMAAARRALPSRWLSKLYPHHVMAAYIYHCPEGHKKQLTLWGFNLINWSNAFLGYISSEPGLSEVELKHWVEAHRETFTQGPR